MKIYYSVDYDRNRNDEGLLDMLDNTTNKEPICGPICNVDGNTIPPFVICSTSEDITPLVIRRYLEHIDKYIKLNRTTATPTLLFDGYGSIFDKLFLS